MAKLSESKIKGVKLPGKTGAGGNPRDPSLVYQDREKQAKAAPENPKARVRGWRREDERAKPHGGWKSKMGVGEVEGEETEE